MRDLDAVFAALARSAFQRRFALGVREGKYLGEKGMETVLTQAHDLIGRRLAPPLPPNDGKQTPMRGHPVFIAQHATATCCRSCLAKWHEIPAGRALDAVERQHVVDAIERWLRAQPLPEALRSEREERQRSLF
ncbi:DUF4186 domain-containing protein [Caballeronia sp. LZ034LL]|uniref:DUF4186 domain-containing protein n=1 Tax=Caballeronia sp. LZ034LL TaxID=3038567 RepID=UPI0028556C51|nr:DUF4186 domain-containing protein [Caballeronia sp. LZ034LL]MDR5838841.1 DUF4186 domain-containing protein [Caballeronia sp. LZ034LL]